MGRVKLVVLLLTAFLFPADILASLPDTQKNFSLEKYMGDWFQIALIPNRFQKKCVGQARANYRLLLSGDVAIVNQCIERDLKLKRADGIAKINKTFNDNARLMVRFAPKWLSLLSFVWGDYWVLAIESDYSAVLVGSPDRKYLWVLARTPTISKKVYRRLTSIGLAQGFNISELVLEGALLD